MKIKTNDEVIVIAGNYKGTKGKVIQALPKTHQVIVEGINERKKHVKPDQANPQGKIITINAPIDVSNVAIVDPKDGKPSRVGYKFDKDGNKVRVAKHSGTIIK